VIAVRYHEATKHHFNRFARSLGYLDWATQPDPFRRYGDAPFHHLPRVAAGLGRASGVDAGALGTADVPYSWLYEQHVAAYPIDQH